MYGFGSAAAVERPPVEKANLKNRFGAAEGRVSAPVRRPSLL